MDACKNITPMAEQGFSSSWIPACVWEHNRQISHDTSMPSGPHQSNDSVMTESSIPSPPQITHSPSLSLYSHSKINRLMQCQLIPLQWERHESGETEPMQYSITSHRPTATASQDVYYSTDMHYEIYR